MAEMNDLTEQWEKGELIEGKKYYCESNIADIFKAECHNKGQNDEWWTLKNGKYCFNNVYHKNDIKVLAPVPSYDEWKAIEKYNKHLEVDIKEKETQRIELMTKLNDVNNENHALEIENTQLKELLKLAKASVDYHCALCREYTDGQILLSKINQALGVSKND